MQKVISTWIIFAGIAVVSLFSSCSKSDNNINQQPTVKKEYRLFNQSSGMPLDAGTFTISQLADGNASLTINLAAGYRVTNVNLPSSIVTSDVTGTELLYASLGLVDGNTGVGLTSPVVMASNNLAVKYIDLIAKTGYLIKVLVGSNVQARGVIL